MTESAQSRQLWPDDFMHEAVIWQATGIVMSRFDLDVQRALEVLRKIATSSGTELSAIAEQVINHKLRLEIMRNLDRMCRASTEFGLCGGVPSRVNSGTG